MAGHTVQEGGGSHSEAEGREQCPPAGALGEAGLLWERETPTTNTQDHPCGYKLTCTTINMYVHILVENFFLTVGSTCHVSQSFL